jgi:hypothetical protein
MFIFVDAFLLLYIVIISYYYLQHIREEHY